MNSRRLRTALVVTAAVSAGLLMTACEGDATATSPAASAESTTSGTAASGSAASGSATPGASGSGTSGSGSSATSGGSSGSGTDASDEAGDKTGYGQSCGTNDLTWSAKEMSQAGGYFLISVKAKEGITCVLPGGLPVVAFGSGGIEAAAAEQVAGDELTLSGDTTAYAGLSPKSTSGDEGVEYTTMIVSAASDDPNPESLEVGTVLVDQPLVTNWHTAAQDAVPFTS
ncbi:DUF4232 domain-containing protein [Streptomyces sp. NPDC088812]|uniref:DUF4232 domain-containing protein n=1 Tax=Streptomyces sp. NPDC088812 TaxID=3365905 RepID=UPI00382A6BE3